MKIYMLIPLVGGDTVEMKEQDGNVYKGTMTKEYSERFGERKYYIDRSSSTSWETSSAKNMYYNGPLKNYFYDVFRPCDITRR